MCVYHPVIHSPVEATDRFRPSRPGQGTEQTSSNLPSLAVMLLAMDKTQSSVVKSETFGCAGTYTKPWHSCSRAGRPLESEARLFYRTAGVHRDPVLKNQL